MNPTGHFEADYEGSQVWADQTEALVRRTAVIADSNLRLMQLLQEKDREGAKVRREVEEQRAELRERRTVTRELREEAGKLGETLV